jgi:hypothetical protein
LFDPVLCANRHFPGQNMPLPADLKDLYRSYQQEIHANSYNSDVITTPLTSAMHSIDKRYSNTLLSIEWPRVEQFEPVKYPSHHIFFIENLKLSYVYTHYILMNVFDIHRNDSIKWHRLQIRHYLLIVRLQELILNDSSNYVCW